MRRALATLLLLPMLGLAQGATPAPEPPVEFIELDGVVIDGQPVKPRGMRLDARQRAKFERLLKLKKDFLREIPHTASDVSLR